MYLTASVESDTCRWWCYNASKKESIESSVYHCSLKLPLGCLLFVPCPPYRSCLWILLKVTVSPPIHPLAQITHRWEYTTTNTITGNYSTVCPDAHQHKNKLWHGVLRLTSCDVHTHTQHLLHPRFLQCLHPPLLYSSKHHWSGKKTKSASR